MLEPLSQEEMEEKSAIIIDYIEEAFETYESSLYSGMEGQIFKFLEAALEMNGEDNSFVDFYFHPLKRKEKEKFLNFLSDEDKKVLSKFNTEKKEIYFPLTKEVLPFVAKITAKEWLFSSFYFTKYPCTVWGNYGKKYPVFFKDAFMVKKYDKLAESLFLRVEYLSQNGYKLKKDRKTRRR